MAVCPAPGGAPCDDGDPCTDDICVAGVCTNVSKVGLDAVTCACSDLQPATCDGQSIPVRVQRYATRACRLFANAASGSPARERRRLRHGARALRRAINAAVHAQLRSLAPDCVAALTDRYREAVDHAVVLADTL